MVLVESEIVARNLGAGRGGGRLVGRNGIQFGGEKGNFLGSIGIQ